MEYQYITQINIFYWITYMIIDNKIYATVWEKNSFIFIFLLNWTVLQSPLKFPRNAFFFILNSGCQYFPTSSMTTSNFVFSSFLRPYLYSYFVNILMCNWELNFLVHKKTEKSLMNPVGSHYCP